MNFLHSDELAGLWVSFVAGVKVYNTVACIFCPVNILHYHIITYYFFFINLFMSAEIFAIVTLHQTVQTYP